MVNYWDIEDPRRCDDFADDDFASSEMKDLVQSFDNAQEWFSETLDILYGKKQFSADRLEQALDELSSYLRVKLPRKDLSVVAMPFNASNEWEQLCMT